MTYFVASGRENVDETLALVKKNAEELGIEDVVIASTTGFTARKALAALKDTGVKLTLAS